MSIVSGVFCMCVYMVYMHVWTQRPETNIKCFLWSALFTETGSPIEPELADAASPTDQLVLKIPSLSPKCWDYSQASMPTKFYMGFGGLRFYMHPSDACVASTLSTEYFSSSLY